MTIQKRNYQLSYSANIDFFVVSSKTKLSSNELRIYWMIKQMEDHKNPDVTPCFSNKHLAETLGVTERHIMHMTSKLKRLGLVNRVKLSRYKYRWYTTTPPAEQTNILLKKSPKKESKKVMSHPVTESIEKEIINRSIEQNLETKKTEETSGKETHRGVRFPITQNNICYISKKETNCETQRSSHSFSEEKAEQILKHKLPEDERSDEEFLNNVKHHINHNSRKTYHVHARLAGMMTILKRLYDSGEIFKSSGYVGPEVMEKMREEKAMRDELYRKTQEAADRAYEERIALYKKSQAQSYPHQHMKKISLKEMLSKKNILIDSGGDKKHNEVSASIQKNVIEYGRQKY